jgi:hypothetical protein
MDNTVHMPNIRVKKNVRNLFGSGLTPRVGREIRLARREEKPSMGVGKPIRHAVRDAWDGAVFIYQSWCNARFGDLLHTEQRNRIGVSTCRGENRKNVRL